MTIEELRKLIFDYTGDDSPYKAYTHDIYVYILGKKDDSVDDRKAMTGGPGIMRYNMEKKEFEKVII